MLSDNIHVLILLYCIRNAMSYVICVTTLNHWLHYVIVLDFVISTFNSP